MVSRKETSPYISAKNSEYEYTKILSTTIAVQQFSEGK